MRYFPAWRGFPTGPWVIIDSDTERAWTRKAGGFFWHGDFEAAQKIAQRLNEKAH
jgi:hypothetical protein